MSLFRYVVNDVLLVDECHSLAEGFCDGGKVVEAYTEPPFLYSAYMVAK